MESNSSKPSEQSASFQQSYIWKNTELDGTLPISNFTEELQGTSTKGKKAKEGGSKDLGEIQEFSGGNIGLAGEGEEVQVGGAVVVEGKGIGVVKENGAGGLIVGRGGEEVAVDFEKEKWSTQVEITARIVLSEEQKFTLIIKRPAGDKLKQVAEEISEIVGISKYKLTFFFRGEKVGLGDKLADKGIGSLKGTDEDYFLLCLMGGNDGPVFWKRFT